MTDEYLEGIMNRDNPDRENNNVPYPICPINLYFEGDEDKCDVAHCDFSTETRSCTEACKIDVEKLQKEIDKIKPQPKEKININEYTRGKWAVAFSDQGLGHGTYGIVIEDTNKLVIEGITTKTAAEEIAYRWNSQPGLVEELADYKEGVEGLKLSIQDLRPYADCYKRVCESLGIEKGILGYVGKLKQHRNDLLAVCKNALPLISGMRIANDAFKPETDLEKHLDKLIRKSEEELETITREEPNENMSNKSRII